MTGPRRPDADSSRRSGRDAGLRRFGDDDRGVSVTVNYALNLVVATLLIGGVLTATGGMVEDRRTSAIETELSVLGERLAADLMAADRLAQAGTDPTVDVSVSLPDRVAATRYEVSVETGPPRVELVSDDPEVTVTVRYRNETDVAPTTVQGGDLRIELNADRDPEPGRLEVTEA